MIVILMNVRKLQVVLSNSDLHFWEMINSHPDAIVLYDREERFVLCNERYYQDQ